MNHLGTKTIETERLLLRPFQVSDAQHMFDNWANDPEVTTYLMWQPHQNVAASRAYLEGIVENYKIESTYEWGIECKEIGQVIGSIGVVRINELAKSVHIGYCVGKAWWGKGFTTEAFSAVIRFLVKDVGVNRIDSRHDPRNVPSGKVMEKCGLRYEGTLRQSDYNNQGVCDAAWYALLSEDYA